MWGDDSALRLLDLVLGDDRVHLGGQRAQGSDERAFEIGWGRLAVLGVEALKLAEKPIRDFMKKFIREKDLQLFLELAEVQAENFTDVPTYVVIPAYMLSEVKTAFEIGFLLFLPFLIIDMVVASVLLSMGMIMLPPILISMPFKLLVFVLVDGWYLVIGSLIRSIVQV